MSKLTQRELLSEGFWNRFKTAARTVGKGALATAKGVGKTIDTVLPELTKPINDVAGGVKGIYKSAKSGWDALQSKKEIIKKSLERQGYMMDETQEPKKLGQNHIVFASQITGIDKEKGEFVWDPKKTIPFIVDKSNNVVKAPNITAQKLKTPPAEEPPPLPPQTQGGTPPPLPPTSTPPTTQAQTTPPAAQAQPQQAPVQPPTNTSTTSPSVSAAPSPTLRPVSSPTARRTP